MSPISHLPPPSPFVPKWSPSGSQVVLKCSPSGPEGVLKWSSLLKWSPISHLPLCPESHNPCWWHQPELQINQSWTLFQRLMTNCTIKQPRMFQINQIILSFDRMDKSLTFFQRQRQTASTSKDRQHAIENSCQPECIADLNSPQVLDERPFYVHKCVHLKK